MNPVKTLEANATVLGGTLDRLRRKSEEYPAHVDAAPAVT
jgi:hypothetical protein